MRKIVEHLRKVFGNEFIELRKQRYSITVKKEEYVSVLSLFKSNGFNQLTFITAVDWQNENEFEIVSNLYSHEYKVNVFVKTRIPRINPVIETITNIYPVAYKYEVELSEMFGIKVEGNNDAGKPFLLENWKDLPPLRKDFNSISYAIEHYQARHQEEKND